MEATTGQGFREPKSEHGFVSKVFLEYGTALVATKGFDPGDVIVIEEPLLVAEEEEELIDRISAFHDQHGISAPVGNMDASMDFSLQLLCFCKAPPDVQVKVLQMWSPDHHTFSEEPYVTAAVRYAELMDTAKSKPKFRESVFAPLIGMERGTAIKVTLTFAMNCHSFHGNSALFEYGSLIMHSCSGNTRYRCHGVGEGKVQHLATSPINAGDLLSTNYLGWDEYTIMSTPSRQRLLYKTKLFNCECDMCMKEIDVHRGLPCPACNVLNSSEPLTAPDDKLGFVYCDMNIRTTAPEQCPWVCDACALTFSEEDVMNNLKLRAAQLGSCTDIVEEHLETRAIAVCELNTYTSVPLEDLESLHEEVLVLLGPRHWTTYFVKYMLIDYHVRNTMSIVEEEEDLSTVDIVLLELSIHFLCELIEATWTWIAKHTRDDPAIVLKANVGPAVDCIMYAVERFADMNPTNRDHALRTAVKYATLLVQAYNEQPFYDVDGLALSVVERVLERAAAAALSVESVDDAS